MPGVRSKRGPVQLIIFALVMLVGLPATADTKVTTVLDNVRPKAVADGDTHTIDLRFQGIDSPEKNQLCEHVNGTCYECGQEAKKALLSIITYKRGNRTKWHVLDIKIWTVGKYGRPVVTAYLNGKVVHKMMSKRGWAVAYRQYLPEELKADYLAAEAEAKAAKRGIWQGNFITPSKWRQGERLTCEN